MNSASIKREKQKNSFGTNYRIRIESKNGINDGKGYCSLESEAVRMFLDVVKKCTKVLKAELWFEGKLIKKI